MTTPTTGPVPAGGTDQSTARTTISTESAAQAETGTTQEEHDAEAIAEAQRIEADLHYNELKATGELQRRRDEAAGLSFFEQNFRRDHG